MNSYFFKTERLGFRGWRESDLDDLYSINTDKEVMEFFPFGYSKEETQQFIKRMQMQYARKGFCYFAVELLADQSFIGFIGLAEQDFAADFTPCIDIGWRLKKTAWNKGYATEGAKACLAYGFDVLALDKIFAIAPLANTKSETIMKKIGMQKIKTFEHPLLLHSLWLKECVLYKATKESLSA